MHVKVPTHNNVPNSSTTNFVQVCGHGEGIELHAVWFPVDLQYVNLSMFSCRRLHWQLRNVSGWPTAHIYLAGGYEESLANWLTVQAQGLYKKSFWHEELMAKCSCLNALNPCTQRQKLLGERVKFNIRKEFGGRGPASP